MPLNVVGWEFRDNKTIPESTTTSASRIRGFDTNVFSIRIRSNVINYTSDKATEKPPKVEPPARGSPVMADYTVTALSDIIEDKEKLRKALILEKHNKLQLDGLSALEAKINNKIMVPGQGMADFTSEEFQYILNMHIPPEEISFTYNQQLTKNKVRRGWKIENWGEDLISIEASGSSGAFYHGEVGITRVNAFATYGYIELMQLVQFYRNNGMSYDPVSGTIYVIGEVIISYDGKEYSGSFDSFDIRESADSPYRFNYQFTFVVRNEIGSGSKVRGHFVSEGTLKQVENTKLMESAKAIRLSKQEEVAQSLANQRAQLRNTLEELRKLPGTEPPFKAEVDAVVARTNANINDTAAVGVQRLNVGISTVQNFNTSLDTPDPKNKPVNPTSGFGDAISLTINETTFSRQQALGGSILAEIKNTSGLNFSAPTPPPEPKK